MVFKMGNTKYNIVYDFVEEYVIYILFKLF